MEGLIASLTVFVLAIFVGFKVFTKVPPTLHSPLMSGSNAISGITLVGSLLSAGHRHTALATALGFAADNALMLFGDARQAILDLAAALEEIEAAA